MKQPTVTSILGCLLVTLAAASHSPSALADTASDCRQEAQDYGISAEELDAYIYGCLASRGELVADDAAGMDYVPPDEMDELQDSLTGDDDAAQ